LAFEVKMRGVAIGEWNDFLNEGRLTALALSLYLAGTTLANTTPPAAMGKPLRLLVLDDVLIGLDLVHRLPVLKIVEDRMPDFQVLLLTHDRVWFDLAQLSVSNPDNWVRYEMYSRAAHDDGVVFDCPVLMPQATDLATMGVRYASGTQSLSNVRDWLRRLLFFALTDPQSRNFCKHGTQFLLCPRAYGWSRGVRNAPRSC